MKHNLLRLLSVLFFAIPAIIPISGHATTYIVDNTTDGGTGSLRQALLNANGHIGRDRIIFNIPSTDPGFDAAAGVWRIRPRSALPALTDNGTDIDGTTQADFTGFQTNPHGPEIVLDGTAAGAVSGLEITSAANTVICLVIHRFERFGIYVHGNSARGNALRGNYVGTDHSGTVAQGNGFSGIIIYTGPKLSVVGGTTTADRNVVSANGWSGVEIQGVDADSNLVTGNFIGTNAAGTAALGNAHHGVDIWSGAQYNTVGGPSAGERNLISGNGWTGLQMIGASTDHNTVVGNYIGTGRTGMLAIPNAMRGVLVRGNQNTIGAAGSGNLISGNGGPGIDIAEGAGHVVAGNIIGTDPGGSLALGNAGHGVSVQGDAHACSIGPSNVVRNNDGDGVHVEGVGCTCNRITRNSIAVNVALGISNVAGGNTELTPPVVLVVTSTQVSGNAPPGCVVEIFSDWEDEGITYEGTTLASALGDFVWHGFVQGPYVTATATDSNGNTSQFSAAVVSVEEGASGAQVLPLAVIDQNRPNPFRASTTISYQIRRPTEMRLAVFDLAGRQVRLLVDQRATAPGTFWATWDGKDERGRDVAAGVYLCRLSSGRVSDAVSMTRVR